ncbi:MAG TPA: NTP transferase domain-containing protein, partial [Rhizomicrobium sp.]
MSKAAIILAAGAGTRMKSALPKVLHKVAAMPLLGHVVVALRAAGVDRIVVVASPAGEMVRDYARALGCESAIQHQQLGTGDAAASAKETLAGFSGNLLVINGDMPLVTGDTITECLSAQARTGLSLLAFQPQDPGSYGRVLLAPDGYLNRIVEFKDATVSERAATLCNAGCYAADAENFFRWASSLNNNNAQREYYLTDVPLLARN